MREGRQELRSMGFRDYLLVAKRRKWIIVQVALLMPVLAVLLSLRQSPLYRSSAEVFVSRQNPAAALIGTQATSPLADRDAQTEADLARVPAVAVRTLRAAGDREMTVADFLAASDVTAATNSDLLEFGVTAGQPATAKSLATAYAREFTAYRRELDTAALNQARKAIERRVADLEASRAKPARGSSTRPRLDTQAGSALYANLIDKAEQLRAAEALVASKFVLVRPASETERVRPEPVRSGLLGLVLGIALGIGLGFFREALDTRMRSGLEVRNELGLRILSRVPLIPRRLQKAKRPVMLAEPHGPEAEAFRILRANLELAALHEAGSGSALMVTSAIEGEGKSTTISNLAIALAQSGRRVILVDLDLRRPALGRLFDLDGAGLTDLALGHVRPEKALARVSLVDSSLNGAGEARGNGRHPLGKLDVLIVGSITVEPGDFVGSDALSETLHELRRRADVVLIDAPPLLGVGDSLVLSSKVDGLILVSRLGVVRRPMIGELRAVLQACPAEKVGVVVSGADPRQVYGESVTYYGDAYRESE